MAKIVLGLGTFAHPHAGSRPTRRFPAAFLETDQNIRHSRQGRGGRSPTGILLEVADPKLAHIVAPRAILVARQNIARAAMRRIRQTVGGPPGSTP